MFDIGFTELLLIAVVALIVLGPERLPMAARFAGRWVRRARAQWYSVKSELEREVAAEELKRSLHDAKRAAEDLKKTMQETEAEVEATVRAAESDARREIEGLRRQATSGLAAGEDAAAPAPVDASPAEASPVESPASDATDAPHQPDLLAPPTDADGRDGRRR